MVDLVASGPIGLETVCASEIAGMGLEVVAVGENEGWVRWRGDLTDVAAANLVLRTVERISVEFEPFHATKFPELRRKAAHFEWERFVGPVDRVALRVTSKRSTLYHERGIGERIAGAIGDRIGRTVEVVSGAELDDPAADVQLVLARMFRDEISIRVDTSGTRLHRRGYRKATGKAPLRESMAAAILASSGWRPGHALVDPFCGAGTIPIEAALWSAGRAPGTRRAFRFERWPQPVVRPELVEPEAPDVAPILGGDREQGAIDASVGNARRAGVDDRVEFVRRALSETEPPAGVEPGWIVTNPPYGARTDRGGEIEALYASFGRLLGERFAGWRCTMLCADDAHARATGLDWTIGATTRNGGLGVRVLHLDD